LIVIDFFATWCDPCTQCAPYFEKLSTTYKNAKFYKVDVDSAQDVAQKCKVKAMPTFKFFKNKQEIGEIVGADMDGVESIIKKHCGNESFGGKGRTLGSSSTTSLSGQTYVNPYAKDIKKEEKKEEKNRRKNC